ncbi:MAG: hypothetical protein E7530_01810 [Ruminococcaceae bacterium]|nr:hypothetical protein [Oscillospiraceae bacterium]
MKTFKRSIAIIFVVIVALSVVAVGVQAASVSTTTSDYGYMMPTDSKFTKTQSTVKLYGSHDYINFYIDAEYDNTYFFYEIYSDKNYTKLVTADYVYCEERGTYTWSPMIKLKGVFSSKTYYCITYGAKMDSSGNVKLSTPSVTEFKIVVDRTTAFNKQVVLLKNVKATVNGPQITWHKHSSAATKYIIYRRSINGTKWTNVGTVGASTLSFTDKSVKNKSGKYVYTVKALNKSGTASRFQFSGLTCLFAEAPVVKSVTIQADNKIQIKWNAASNATYYRVYRKTNGGSWEVIQKAYRGGTTYTDTTAVSGNNYQYTVRTYINTSHGTAISAYNAGKGIDYVASPELTGVNVVDNGMELRWNEAKGATAYTVYRRPLDKSSGWASIGKVNADVLNFVDETAESDGAYLYTVRSEGTTSRGSYNSKGIEYLVLQEPLMTVTETDKGVKITWDAVPLADKYQVYYRVSGGDWVKATVTYYRYYDMTIKGCGEYEFTVRAIRNNIFSEFATSSQPIMFFPKVSTSTTIYKDYNLVGWTSVKADSYNLYRKTKDADDSEYALIYSGDKTSYKDMDVAYDVGYTYVAKAIYNDIEQTERLTETSMVRYDSEKYINSFNVTKRYSYGTEFFNISYDLTEEAKDVTVRVLCLTGSATSPYWDYVHMGYPAVNHTKPATEKAQLAIVVSDGIGSTPRDAVISIVENEKCDRPDVKYRGVKGGVEIFWDAVENADSYELRFENIKDFHREIKSDGSSTYCVFISNEEFDGTIKKDNRTDYVDLYMDVVHTNGNITEGEEYRIGYSSEIPRIIIAREVSNGVEIAFGDDNVGGSRVVFRKAPGETSWKKIGTGSSDGYLDKTAKKGVKYSYTVRCYSTKMGCYTSYYDTKGLTVGKVITPKLTSIENNTYGVRVECEEISTRYGISYHLYRKTENGKWQKIASNLATEGLAFNFFRDETAKTGVKYYYTIIATYGSAKSSYDPDGLSIVYVQTPTLKSATRTSTGITVKWSEVEGADGYYVYRKTYNTGWTRVGTVKNGSTVAFTDKTAEQTGVLYRYTVKAYNGSSTSGYNTTGKTCS